VARRGGFVSLLCRTDRFSLEINLNPLKGWMPERLEYKRFDSVRGDLGPMHLVYSVGQSDANEDVWLPASYHCEISKPSNRRKLPKHLQVVDGKLIVKRTGGDAGANFIENPPTTLIADVMLSSVSYKPLGDSDFQMQASVPDGLRVSMGDAPQLDYVWVDGKIVPWTDAMPFPRGARFLKGDGSRASVWFVGLNVVIITVLAFWSWRFRR